MPNTNDAERRGLLKSKRRAALKPILVILAVLVVIAGVAVGLHIRSTVKSVNQLFKRNAELKAQGYYLGEFEFKMLTTVYYLNEGSYVKAYTTIRRIRNEMETTRGLVKMPSGASPEEMMTFLLDRQDPTTGAFMDPSYPVFSYIAPTVNAIDALDRLSKKTGRPLKLRYQLRFLDQIRTPEQLRAYLNSLLYMKETWAEMSPVAPYNPGVSELAYFNDLERRGVYQFSDEWKDAFRQWIYETQDPATGYWGFRVGTPSKWRPCKSAINATYHLLQALVLTTEGENQSEKYPLRYAGTLGLSVLKDLDKPVPNDRAGQHAWALDQAQGAGTIALIWAQLPESEQERARAAMRTYLTIRYRQFFRPADGAFSLYTSAPQADVDGTSTALGLLRSTGSLPGTWQRQRLWGRAIAAAPKAIRTEVRKWEEATVPAAPEIQSIRVYKDALPAGDTFEYMNLVQIVYPGKSPVLDVMDLRQHMTRFINRSGQAYGNWTSLESLGERLGIRAGVTPAIPVFEDGLNLARAGRAHPAAKRFYVIGYDTFQVPIYRAEFVKVGSL